MLSGCDISKGSTTLLSDDSNTTQILSRTIIFEENGGTNVDDITIFVDNEIQIPENPTKTGYTFAGWYSDLELSSVFNFDSLPDEDITLYAKWLVNSYTVTFETNGGSIINLITQDYDTDLIEPAEPTKIGCIFDGWYSDSNLITSYHFTTVPAENITVYAKWILAVADDVSDYSFYLLEDDTYQISRYNGSNSKVVIPSFYLGKPVTVIGYNAFYGNETITNIYFQKDSQLTRIDTQAFQKCKNLSTITIPPTVTSIGANVFGSCWNLRSVTFPSSILYIDQYIFQDCLSLESISVEGDNQFYISENGVLFDKQKTLLISYPAKKNDTTFQLPSSIVEISGYAFNNNHFITEIIFDTNSQLLTIDVGAFLNCSNLQDIIFPDTLTSIGQSSFAGCSSLEVITITENISAIYGNPFPDCSSLTSINVDEDNQNFTAINKVLFDKQVTNLIGYPGGLTSTSYEVPSTVTSIGIMAFAKCVNLKNISIPNSVTTIGGSAFYGCTNLTTIIISVNVEVMGYWVFDDCAALTIYTEHLAKPNGWSDVWNPDNLPVNWGYDSSD
ncbi:MAG: leucine-rich repeat protein [Candidatus Izemoplasmatales bacterium]|nr:leucine-rich repeat protein [Candidatus Izemoplasmatales bacterium]